MIVVHFFGIFAMFTSTYLKKNKNVYKMGVIFQDWDSGSKVKEQG